MKRFVLIRLVFYGLDSVQMDPPCLLVNYVLIISILLFYSIYDQLLHLYIIYIANFVIKKIHIQVFPISFHFCLNYISFLLQFMFRFSYEVNICKKEVCFSICHFSTFFSILRNTIKLLVSTVKIFFVPVGMA